MSAVLSASTPSWVPAPLTSFIGREREVAAVCDLLAIGRFVTLTGAGGSGKTRRHYDHVVVVLRRELGSAPARETVALYDQLRRASFGS